MKKLTIGLSLFVLLLLTAVPTFAYGGVNVRVFDSLDQNAWQYGGDVFLISDLDGIVGTGELDGIGEVVITHGAGSLCGAVGGCNAVTNGAIVTIVIDFECQTSGNVCNPPEGIPATSGDTTYTQNVLPFNFTANVNTGTGPTAVTLNTTGAQAGTSMMLLAGSLLVLLLGTATVLVVRRRQQASLAIA